jgi:glutathione S-transferase
VISARLEKDYPGMSIYPDNAANKGLCLALEDWSDEVIIHANHAIRRAETAEARKKAEAEWDVHFNTLDQMYSGKRFIFDRLTIADAAIFSQLHYLYTAVKYEVPAKYKNVHAFMENMRQTLKLKSLSDSFEAQSLLSRNEKIPHPYALGIQRRERRGKDPALAQNSRRKSAQGRGAPRSGN